MRRKFSFLAEDINSSDLTKLTNDGEIEHEVDKIILQKFDNISTGTNYFVCNCRPEDFSRNDESIKIGNKNRNFINYFTLMLIHSNNLTTLNLYSIDHHFYFLGCDMDSENIAILVKSFGSLLNLKNFFLNSINFKKSRESYWR